MPENINIKSDEIVCISRGQAVVEARQPIGPCRVLSATATAVTTPSEVFSGEARYVGKVTFDCLVAVESGVECVSAVAEFSDKIASPAIGAGTAIKLIPEITNVEATVEGGSLKLVAVVDTVALAVAGNDYSCLSVPDNGIYAEKRSISYCTVSAVETETVYVTDSVGITRVADVLFTSNRAVVTGAETAAGEVKVSGAVYSTVTVRTDDGTVTSLRVVTPFVKSIAALGVGDGDTAFATVTVSDGAANIIAGENRLELASTVMIDIISLGVNTAEIVTDVFCADNEIEKKVCVAKCQSVEPLCTVIDTVDGQIPIAADRLAADNVLCVTGAACALTSARIEDNRVIAEGLVSGDIVYYNAESNAVDTLSFRLPFSTPLSVHTDAQNVTAICTVTDVNVRVRRESVFDIKAEIAFTLRLTSEHECEFIESVTIGEPIERPDATVIVHIARPGETLWQAAKALCCSPERVEQQNTATAPYEGGERLINFCGK